MDSTNGNDPGNVHFVDSVKASDGGTNYLFRGSKPLNADNSFNYPGLISALKNAGRKANIIMPAEYRIYDINLQQWENAGEVPQIESEYDFFKKNTDKGWFDFWETKGTGICPFLAPLDDHSVMKYLALNLDQWLSDTLVTRTENLRRILEWKPSPTVVYVHCSGGVDRTGEMMGAYYLRWMNMTWEEVNIRNLQCAGIQFGCNNYRAALWYAIYLYLTCGKPVDYMKPFQCNNAGTIEVACGDIKS
jgi:hypothetical protein